jgi:hypothetical protein
MWSQGEVWVGAVERPLTEMTLLDKKQLYLNKVKCIVFHLIPC